MKDLKEERNDEENLLRIILNSNLLVVNGIISFNNTTHSTQYIGSFVRHIRLDIIKIHFEVNEILVIRFDLIFQQNKLFCVQNHDGVCHEDRVKTGFPSKNKQTLLPLITHLSQDQN